MMLKFQQNRRKPELIVFFLPRRFIPFVNKGSDAENHERNTKRRFVKKNADTENYEHNTKRRFV